MRNTRAELSRLVASERDRPAESALHRRKPLQSCQPGLKEELKRAVLDVAMRRRGPQKVTQSWREIPRLFHLNLGGGLDLGRCAFDVARVLERPSKFGRVVLDQVGLVRGVGVGEDEEAFEPFCAEAVLGEHARDGSSDDLGTEHLGMSVSLLPVAVDPNTNPLRARDAKRGKKDRAAD